MDELERFISEFYKKIEWTPLKDFTVRKRNIHEHVLSADFKSQKFDREEIEFVCTVHALSFLNAYLIKNGISKDRLTSFYFYLFEGKFDVDFIKKELALPHTEFGFYYYDYYMNEDRHTLQAIGVFQERIHFILFFMAWLDKMESPAKTFALAVKYMGDANKVAFNRCDTITMNKLELEDLFKSVMTFENHEFQPWTTVSDIGVCVLHCSEFKQKKIKSEPTMIGLYRYSLETIEFDLIKETSKMHVQDPISYCHETSRIHLIPYLIK